MTKHVFEKVTTVAVIGDYRLRVHFSDGTDREIDFEPVLHGGIYGALRNKAVFNQVIVDAEVGVICWPNGADFDSSILYQWDVVKDELGRKIAAAESAELASR
ncbi:MAG: DUF2442 domain-containing protein [Verrucomicrobia bacterium]|nr:DUF2442 domain-containing protein [Verrucomicrobiota bacterium]